MMGAPDHPNWRADHWRALEAERQRIRRRGQIKRAIHRVTEWAFVVLCCAAVSWVPGA